MAHFLRQMSLKSLVFEFLTLDINFLKDFSLKLTVKLKYWYVFNSKMTIKFRIAGKYQLILVLMDGISNSRAFQKTYVICNYAKSYSNEFLISK